VTFSSKGDDNDRQHPSGITKDPAPPGLSAALLLVAAPVALADAPGYYFQDLNQPSPANVSNSPRTATSAQIAAVNRKADQALETARRASRAAQQRRQAAQ
jgi:hypothetical protein